MVQKLLFIPINSSVQKRKRNDRGWLSDPDDGDADEYYGRHKKRRQSWSDRESDESDSEDDRNSLYDDNDDIVSWKSKPKVINFDNFFLKMVLATHTPVGVEHLIASLTP